MGKLFAGIKIVDMAALAEIKRVQDALPFDTEFLNPLSKMHITTKFYGDVTDTTKERLIHQFPGALYFNKFALKLTPSIGVFNNAEVVFWLGVTSDPSEKLYDVAMQCNFVHPTGGLSFKPHITLAKIPKAAFQKSPSFPSLKIAPVTFDVSEVGLYETVKDAAGVTVYQEIAKAVCW